MSKELETIKSFQNKRTFDVTYDNGTQKHFETKTIGELFPVEINKIETELNEFEEYKTILKDFGLENPQNLIDNLNIIKDSKFHEKLKALEIIKEKKWLVEDILNAFIEDKEEYDLLKEVLE